MADEWPDVPLADLVDPLRGISYGIVQPGQPDADGVPIVRVSNVRNGRIETESPLRVSADIEGAYGRTRLRGGEILITIVGTIGETAIVPPELAGWNVARAIAVIPVNPDIGSYWVRVALGASDAAAMIHSRLNTTVQATLNLGDLARLPILLPPAPERNAIAHILGTLDDRIDANRRVAATLEEMARALFRAWFVTFEPVRAKAEGRWRPGQTLPGLPASLYDTFPDRLVETEHGEIPEGWRLGALSDIATLNPEVWTRATRPAAINYVDLANTKWGRIETIQHLARDEAPSRAQRVLKPGDTIVGTVRPGNGSFAFVATVGLTGSTGFAQLRAKQERVSALIYLAATAQENIEALTHLADGAAYPAVRPEVVAATRVMIPGQKAIEAFDVQAANWLMRTSIAEQESRALATIRDSLLPKLVSGAIRVKDAEAFLKARGL